jgi:hypothetical protein
MMAMQQAGRGPNHLPPLVQNIQTIRIFPQGVFSQCEYFSSKNAQSVGGIPVQKYPVNKNIPARNTPVRKEISGEKRQSVGGFQVQNSQEGRRFQEKKYS